MMDDGSWMLDEGCKKCHAERSRSIKSEIPNPKRTTNTQTPALNINFGTWFAYF